VVWEYEIFLPNVQKTKEKENEKEKEKEKALMTEFTGSSKNLGGEKLRFRGG